MADYFNHNEIGPGTATNTVFTVPASTPTGAIGLYLLSIEDNIVPQPPAACARLRNEDEDAQLHDAWFWWERFAASQGGTTRTITHGSAWRQGILVVVQNVHANAIPRIGRPNQGNSTIPTALSVKPIGNDAYILFTALSFGDQNSAGSRDPPSGSTPTFTERFDSAQNIYFADGTLGTAGATGDKSMASALFSAASDWISTMIVVEDDGASVGSAQRFYLPASGAAPASPSFSSDWTGAADHNNSVRRPMSKTKGATTLADTTFTPDSADHIALGQSLFVQFVSSETFQAQTIVEQQVRLIIGCLEANAGNNLFLCWKLMACAADDNAVLATLVAQKTQDIAECLTTRATRGDAAVISETTIAESFRLVLEIGLGGTPVASGGVQGHNGTMRFGESSGSDLADDDVGTTDNNPYLEIAVALTEAAAATFAPPPFRRLRKIVFRRR